MVEDGLFPTYTEENWRNAFTKEIGEGSIESFYFQVDGQCYEPYSSYDPGMGAKGKLPKVTLKTGLGEIFDYRSNNKPLKHLLESLAHGYDHPFIMIDETTGLSDFSDVHMDFINPLFEIHEEKDSTAVSFISKLNQFYSDKKWEANYILATHKYEISAPKILIELRIEKTVAEMAEELTEVISKTQDFNPEDLIIRFVFTGQLVKDVIKSRAIKIYYLNWLQINGHKLSPYLCHITWELAGDYPNEMLVHTNNIIAATMAQADVILMNIKENSGDRGRILRNAAHIALIESGLGNDPDPIAGSYFIEMVATDLAEKAFES